MAELQPNPSAPTATQSEIRTESEILAESEIRADVLPRIVRKQHAALLGGLVVTFSALIGGMVLDGHPLLLGGTLAILFAALAYAGILGRRARPDRTHATIEVREGDLFADGVLLASRKDVETAMLVPDSGRVVVRVVLRSPNRVERGALRPPPLELAVADAATGRALLERLGFGASQRRLELNGPSRFVTGNAVLGIPVGAFAIMGLQFAGWISPAGTMIAFVGFFLAFMALLVVPTKISVGIDGVLLRWFGWHRFLPFDDVASVEEQRGVLVFRMRDGTERRVAVGPRRAGDPRKGKIPLPSIDVAALVRERAAEAIDARARRGEPNADAHALARGHHDMGTWFQRLRGVIERGGSFRGAPLTSERLFGVVEDNDVDAPTRAAAAIALSQNLDDAGKARLRSACEAVVAPRLRIALDAAAREDERAMREALAELEAESVSRARARRT